MGADCDQSFFGPHTEYDIAMKFTLAKSTKNWETQCMVYLHVLDCRGLLLASSARSLRLPYQSSAVLRLDSLLRLPLYLANMLHESETVNVNMMLGFREAGSSSSPPLPPAHSLRVLSLLLLLLSLLSQLSVEAQLTGFELIGFTELSSNYYYFSYLFTSQYTHSIT